MELGVPLILVAAVLFVVGLLLRRVRPDKKQILGAGEAPAKPSMFGGARKPPEPEEPAFEPPHPPVAGFERAIRR